VVTTRELSNTTELSVFKSVFVPILTYGHEPWVLSQVQAAVMGFLRIVHGATQGRSEVRCCPEQKTSLAPPCSNLRPFGCKYTVLKTKLPTLLRLFGAPIDSAPGALCLLFPSHYTAGVTLGDILRNCEIRRALNFEELLRVERSQFGHVFRIPHERLARQVLQTNPRKSGPRPRWSNYISDLAWSRLCVEPAELQYLKFLLTVMYSMSS